MRGYAAVKQLIGPDQEQYVKIPVLLPERFAQQGRYQGIETTIPATDAETELGRKGTVAIIYGIGGGSEDTVE
jgi:hypothetical protein